MKPQFIIKTTYGNNKRHNEYENEVNEAYETAWYLFAQTGNTCIIDFIYNR